jgi:hypothetical protein
MSSDPTRPQQPPEWNPEAPTKQYPAGGQPRPTFTPNEQYQPPQQPPQQPYQPPPQQPYQPPQPPQQAYQPPEPPYQPPPPGYEPQPGYESQPGYEPQPQYRYDQQYAGAPAGRTKRRRRRWPIVTGAIVIVLLVLAVGADRVANYEAENQMANQIKQNGLPVKPHVSIKGFPFLTQLAAKDFNEVVISASNVTEGSLTIASINATMHGMHLINGFTGARIDTLDGSALITYQALANAGSFPSGVTLGPGANPSQIKASVSVLGFGTSATVQITKKSSNEFNVRTVDDGGIAGNLLGNLVNYTFKVPELPAGMSIGGVTATQQGVVITITGHNTTLTQPGS